MTSEPTTLFSSSRRHFALWLSSAVGVLFAAQVLRMNQADPAVWIGIDYAGRIFSLAILAISSPVRRIAFRKEQGKLLYWKTIVLIIVCLAIYILVAEPLGKVLNSHFPNLKFGKYPSPQGFLFYLDLFFGLWLVSYSEEVIFRRCGRAILETFLPNTVAIIAISSAFFAAYHWWSGIGNVVQAFIFGVLMMIVYLKAEMLTPCILTHWLLDFKAFAY